MHPFTVYRALWAVVEAVNATHSLDLEFQLHNPARRLSHASGFQLCRNSPFDNLCGALDGIAVEHEQPLATDVPRVADCYLRKESYAFNVQAISDSDYN